MNALFSGIDKAINGKTVSGPPATLMIADAMAVLADDAARAAAKLEKFIRAVQAMDSRRAETPGQMMRRVAREARRRRREESEGGCVPRRTHEELWNAHRELWAAMFGPNWRT